MKMKKEQLVIKKEDFDILTTYIRNGGHRQSIDRSRVTELETELKKAKLVPRENFPDTVVGLNSTAVVKDMETQRILAVTIVTPDKADISQNKISVLAPIGTALLGFQKGKQISWQVPAGEKKLLILDVF
ncbi:GreA/GreB family elongation factor [Chitinophaga filiformis]|uniref:GreA/GreB family elongation factor n=1 Tax=Chitinophaga filiformis TaxID=104663 RepID=A0ABY4IAH3_CHIFI|nr:GreA/GreB family elongation factor [Chitinophaga filiformis]UPK72902.1 GreA/GreB family elongation factor [Chitinophaga filiformis]